MRRVPALLVLLLMLSAVSGVASPATVAPLPKTGPAQGVEAIADVPAQALGTDIPVTPFALWNSGDRLVFIGPGQKADSYGAVMYLPSLQAQGLPPRPLTGSPVFSAAWGPDNQLAFVAPRPSSRQDWRPITVYLKDLRTGETRDLLPGDLADPRHLHQQATSRLAERVHPGLRRARWHRGPADVLGRHSQGATSGNPGPSRHVPPLGTRQEPPGRPVVRRASILLVVGSSEWAVPASLQRRASWRPSVFRGLGVERGDNRLVFGLA